MALLFAFCFFFLLSPSATVAAPIAVLSIPTNFTTSYQHLIDNSGAFLASHDNSFQARITNPKTESRFFYFIIVHTRSNTIIWTPNRNKPLNQSSQLRLTSNALALYNDTGDPIWSTPSFLSPISALHLLDSGNLILLDLNNNTLWQSFNFPTDTVVVGQKLLLGKALVSSVSDDNISEGDYRFTIGEDNAMLQWKGMNYWMLSMDNNANRHSNFPIRYLVMNFTGLYFMAENGSQVVVSVRVTNSSYSSSDFNVVKLDSSGLFSVLSIYPTASSILGFPGDRCEIPLICKRLGVCNNGGNCYCAAGFHLTNDGDCVPTDGSLSLPSPTPCNDSSRSGANIKYLNLSNGLDYFSNGFTGPVVRGVNLSWCLNLCSSNCSCLGVFHSEATGYCYMIRNYLGSIMSKSSNSLGYVKTIDLGTRNVKSENKTSDFPVLAAVLLPSTGGIVVIVIVLSVIWCRRRRRLRKSNNSKYWSSSEEDEDFVTIPGLPVRLSYQELVEATGGFATQIGSGGFGLVYKGSLQDGTEVAVKKITCLGARGKKEFLAEIAVIGKIHHVNLVRLKGFCTHGGQRFLVYEYMNRGSLDRTLFQGETVLEWQERYEIALGTARGLAYLHSECDNTIIHCDVKPENILLHDKLSVKISDFGLSKLLSSEQSGVFTTLRGTRGYLAPEWLTGSAISEKSDVYSYGMVLLEIVRGKKNSSLQPQSHSSGTDTSSQPSPSSSRESGNRPIYFPLLALQMHEEMRYLEALDPRLMGKVSTEEVEKLVRVALCCVHEEPNLRPSMSNVVGMLEGGVALGVPRIESLNFLRFYGRRFMEASTLGENSNEGNEAMVYRQTAAATATSSYNFLSHISSQQVSGPR